MGFGRGDASAEWLRFPPCRFLIAWTRLVVTFDSLIMQASHGSSTNRSTATLISPRPCLTPLWLMRRQHARMLGMQHPATGSMMILVMAAAPSTSVSPVIIGRLPAPEAVSMKNRRSLAPHQLPHRLPRRRPQAQVCAVHILIAWNRSHLTLSSCRHLMGKAHK